EFSSWIFLAGANALMTGNYLTTKGISYTEDLKFIEKHGLEVDYVVS
ncbi:MAG: biotin synthase BioB, partial [Thermodesulfovibrio sp.]|nr:biotin synthase BioB [Thermodesulfovibrio sp.]